MLDYDCILRRIRSADNENEHPFARNSLVVADIASECVPGELKVAHVGMFGIGKFFQMDVSS